MNETIRRRWRVLILVMLTAAPFLFILGFGAFQLWRTGWSFWIWWPMAGCLALAYVLGAHWQKKRRLLRLDTNIPLHWTDRDREAWRVVIVRADAAAKLDAEKLSSVPFYAATAQEMALELAQFYHPGAQDPIGSLTLPEILAVVELAASDLAEMVDQYLPGGHFMTINHLRRARQATDWYQKASSLYWAISTVFSPVNTGMRFLASQAGLSRPFQMLQQNLLLWFYSAFVHRLGTYLIDLHSGRLRVGAQRYRQLLNEARGATEPEQPAAEAADAVRSVCLAVVGQVKAGKSSLINGLLGEQKARTDVLPATSEITRYELQPPGIPTRLVLLDSVGYGHAGPRADQMRATEQAVRQADIVLLVVHARNPARQADLTLLENLSRFFNANPDLKMAPILGVLTHIDLLSPAMEWDPPYQLVQPVRLKEEQIDAAMATVREQLGTYLCGVVPVCAGAGRVYGVQEWLLPALAELLDQAHAVAFLRCLRAEVDAGKMRKVFYQLLASGREAAKVLWGRQR